MPRPQPRHSTSKVSLLLPPYRVYPRLRIYNSKLVITCHTPGPLQNSAIYSRTLASHCGNQKALQFSSSRTEALDGRHEGSQKGFPCNFLTKLVNLMSQLQDCKAPCHLAWVPSLISIYFCSSLLSVPATLDSLLCLEHTRHIHTAWILHLFFSQSVYSYCQYIVAWQIITQFSSLEQHTLLSHSFCGSGVWAQLNWVLYFRVSHKPATKLSARPRPYLKAWLRKDPLPSCQWNSVPCGLLDWAPQLLASSKPKKESARKTQSKSIVIL